MGKNKESVTEWSFSFDKLGETISDAVNSVVDAVSSDEEVKMASFSEEIGAAASAIINLNLSVGETTVKPLAASNNLFEADVTYIGEMEFTATGDTEKKITLRQENGRNFFKKALGAARQH